MLSHSFSRNLVALFIAAAFFLPQTLRAEPAQIVIGAKNFTENRLLAEIMAQLIEAQTDIVVQRRPNLGGTMVVFSALQSGEIDGYPSYTGTGWSTILKRKGIAPSLKTYTTVAAAYQDKYQLTWLTPFGFNNTYAIAMHKDAAEKLGVTRVSQLGPHLSTLRAGFSHEFLSRADGWPGLAKAYGFDPGLVLNGMEHGLAYEAISSGHIDLVDTYSTDGKLRRFPVVKLQDDKHFFPPYDCAPVFRTDTLARLPQLRPVLNMLAYKLPDARMQDLNAAVEVGGKDFDDVAHAFLQKEGLLGTPTAQGNSNASATSPEFKSGIQRTWDLLAKPLTQHIFLTTIALLLAVLFAVPLGIVLSRNPRLAGPVIGATGVIQTIPSLALLAFMIPIPGLGLGSRSAILALFLYALLPIVRNTFTGITQVDPDLVEAARGMGLTDRQRLFLVELPLASRTIMAGIRTSAVIGIGVATLAAFVGAGGLGDPIITGLQLNDMRIVLTGAIPAALLAVTVDLLLAVAERRLTGARSNPEI